MSKEYDFDDSEQNNFLAEEPISKAMSSILGKLCLTIHSEDEIGSLVSYIHGTITLCTNPIMQHRIHHLAERMLIVAQSLMMSHRAKKENPTKSPSEPPFIKKSINFSATFSFSDHSHSNQYGDRAHQSQRRGRVVGRCSTPSSPLSKNIKCVIVIICNSNFLG